MDAYNRISYRQFYVCIWRDEDLGYHQSSYVYPTLEEYSKTVLNVTKGDKYRHSRGQLITFFVVMLRKLRRLLVSLSLESF